MEQDGSFQKQLSLALTKALPTKGHWQRMASYELHVSLDEISTSGTIDDIAFEVIRWAISKGREEDLIKGALQQNGTNPELLQFYREVWLPLLNADSKLRQTPQVSATTDMSVALPDTDSSLEMNTSLSIPSTLENDGASPDSTNTPSSRLAERLRKCLLAYTLNVREAIQKTHDLFTQGREIYRDECQIAFQHIRQKDDDLDAVLSKLLKRQLVGIKLHSQFGAHKDYFKKEVEKVISPLISQPNGQGSLPYHVYQDMCTKLASLQKSLDDIDHYICDFCCQIDQHTNIDQFDFCP